MLPLKTDSKNVFGSPENVFDNLNHQQKIYFEVKGIL
jgi:hypothetical protein